MDHFACVVCKEKSSSTNPPRMCPECTRFCCGSCFDSNLYDKNCAHCESSVLREKYIVVSWATEVHDQLKMSQTTTTTTTDVDPCPRHENKQLSIFCQDCSKTYCSACWLADHDSHKIVPLEAAHDQFQSSLRDYLDVVTQKESAVKGFRKSLSRDLAELNRNYEHIRIEEIIKTNDMQRLVSKSFDKQHADMVDPIETSHLKITKRLQSIRYFIDDVEEAKSHKKLNYIVDRGTELMKGPLSEDEEAELTAIVSDYESPDLDQIRFKTPWKPDWDFQEEVTIEDCHQSPIIVRWFQHNDVKWSVFVSNPSFKSENGEPTPLQLTIGVFMEGRDQLNNYEFAIESLYPPSLSDEEEKEWMEESMENEEPPPPPPPPSTPRLEMVLTEPFEREEELFFPVIRPKSWINDQGGMSFLFMVRPLTFQQKCEDLEIYLEKITKGNKPTFSSSVEAVGDGSEEIGAQGEEEEEEEQQQQQVEQKFIGESNDKSGAEPPPPTTTTTTSSSSSTSLHLCLDGGVGASNEQPPPTTSASAPALMITFMPDKFPFPSTQLKESMSSASTSDRIFGEDLPPFEKKKQPVKGKRLSVCGKKEKIANVEVPCWKGGMDPQQSGNEENSEQVSRLTEDGTETPLAGKKKKKAAVSTPSLKVEKMDQRSSKRKKKMDVEDVPIGKKLRKRS